MLVQTSANINYYDDEGLDPAYNQDNIHNSGFSIPYAILGFTGKAFDRVTTSPSMLPETEETSFNRLGAT